MGPKQALGPVGTPGPVDPNPLSRFQIKKKVESDFWQCTLSDHPAKIIQMHGDSGIFALKMWL